MNELGPWFRLVGAQDLLCDDSPLASCKFISIKVVNRVPFDPRLPISFTTVQEVGIYSNQKQKMGLA